MSRRHFDFWPRDVPTALTLPETSLWYNLEVSARRYPHTACTIFYDSVLTYARVRDEAERLAGYLQRRCGVKRGDRVALYMQNSPAYLVAFYAVLRADAMVVPVNPMNQRDELRHILTDSGARVLIGSQELLAATLAALDAGDGGGRRELQPEPAPHPARRARPRARPVRARGGLRGAPRRSSHAPLSLSAAARGRAARRARRLRAHPWRRCLEVHFGAGQRRARTLPAPPTP